MSELRFLRLREVAEMTGIPYCQVKADAASGFAPTVPVGRGVRRQHRRMTVEQVRRYHEAHQLRAGAQPPAPQKREESADPRARAVAASQQLARRARRRTQR